MVSAAIFALAIGTLCHLAKASVLKSSLNLTSSLGAIRETYTTNAICGKKNCINPIFPGLEDLHRLQQAKWISSSLQKTAPSMGFCRNAISYDPALPMPAGGSSSVKELVKRQDNAASTMFYYHVTGLGLEAWDYKKPEFANDCIKSIWRMVCFTYFPRAAIGSQDGSFSDYLRPCQSSCFNYIRQCGVECCDESVKCVFSHTKAISATQTVTTEGYIPHDGPSSLCTGAARRSAMPFGAGFWALAALTALFSLESLPSVGGMSSFLRGRQRLLWVGALTIMALSLQGCDYDVPVHNVGNWRAEPDYLITHSFVAPGASARSAGLNSCSITRLSLSLQCSGRGVCKLWDPFNGDNHLSFCECDRDWSDPECRTRRKSQAVAYLLSITCGFLGADQFYLGFPLAGFLKLFTGGGFGAWWIMDIVRIGSAPVYSSNYLVAHDLPHYLFVVTVIMFACGLGFAVAFYVVLTNRANKRAEAMLLQGDEEARQKDALKPFTDAYSMGSMGQGKPIVQRGPGGPDGPYGAMSMGQMPGMGMPGMMGGPMPP